jgi:ornithine--oxo-acid transaminase
MDVFNYGTHGSTFGGNALSSAVGIAALDVLLEEKMIENAAAMGEYFLNALKKIESPYVKEVRGKGLMIGVEIDTSKIEAKTLCKRLLERGIVSKETHDVVIRLAPPLVITKAQLDDALAILHAVLTH